MTDLQITVTDKDLKRVGLIGNPISCSFTPRFNAQGTGQLVLHRNDRALTHMISAQGGLTGARVDVTYRGQRLMSGPVWGIRGGFTPGAPVIAQVRDDWMLTENLAWVRPNVPAAPASLADLAQAVSTGPNTPGTIENQSGYMLWPDGTVAAGGISLDSREAAVKWLLEANLRGRLGINIEARENLHRGGAATGLPQVRMSTLAEALSPILTAGDLGLWLGHLTGEDSLSADVWEPGAYDKTLDIDSGVLTGGEWSINPPEVTRATVGGPGDLAARAFWEVVDSALEERYGTVLERFRDATSGDLKWGSTAEVNRVQKYYLLRDEVASADKQAFVAYLNAAAEKLLTEGKPTASLSVELAETKQFRFGEQIRLGTRLTVADRGIPFSDRITEATIVLDKKGKETVTPILGDKKDDTTRQMAQAIAALARSQRRQLASR
jgi:hypothetical protein